MHTVKFEYDIEDDYQELYIYTILDPNAGFFKRLWCAIKFLLRHDYPIVGDTIVGPENAMKIRNLCEKYLEKHDIKEIATEVYSRQWKPYNPGAE